MCSKMNNQTTRKIKKKYEEKGYKTLVEIKEDTRLVWKTFKAYYKVCAYFNQYMYNMI